MLATIKTLLEDTAAAQGLNFLFSSFDEINPAIGAFDLDAKSTILVNSTIKSKQQKTEGNAFKQKYFLHIACVRKRKVEEKDNDVFEVIALTEPDFITYLNAIGESPNLSEDLGEIEMDTIYFDSAMPTAGFQSRLNMKTFCQQ